MSKKGLFVALMGVALLTAQTGGCAFSHKQGGKKLAAAANNTANASMGSVQWMTDFSAACAKAKKENKYLFLFFTGSDWCGWCKKMESEVFKDPQFAQTVGNRFVFVDLDFPMGTQLPEALAKQNDSLKKKFGVTGFPTVVILGPEGNFVAETGYRPGGGKAFGDYLLQLIQ